MNKIEIIKALKLGVKVTHNSLDDGQYFYQKNHLIIDEKGTKTRDSYFWQENRDRKFEKGWSIIK